MQGNYEIGKTDWSEIKLWSTISDPQPSSQCFTVIHRKNYIFHWKMVVYWNLGPSRQTGATWGPPESRWTTKPNARGTLAGACWHPFTKFLIWLSKMQYRFFRSFIFPTMNKINWTKKQKKLSRSKVTKMSFWSPCRTSHSSTKDNESLTRNKKVVLVSLKDWSYRHKKKADFFYTMERIYIQRIYKGIQGTQYY